MLGVGIDEVTQAVKEASEIYPFMKWLEPYIEPWKTVSNFKNVGAEQEFDKDTGEESRPITPGSETDTEPASNSFWISKKLWRTGVFKVSVNDPWLFLWI